MQFYSPFENVSNELDKIKETIKEEKLFFDEELCCPNCNTRISDLMETGYVGCTNCYKVFGKELAEMIYDFHHSTEHRDKRTKKANTKARKQKEIEELLKQQAKASAEEDYILAQQIKEKVEKLKGEL